MNTLMNTFRFVFNPVHYGPVLLTTPIRQFGLVFALWIGVWVLEHFLQPTPSGALVLKNAVVWIGSFFLTLLFFRLGGIRVAGWDLAKYTMAGDLLARLFSILTMQVTDFQEPGDMLHVLWMGPGFIWLLVCYCKGLAAHHRVSPWKVFWLSIAAFALMLGLARLLIVLGWWPGFLGVP